MKTIQDERNRCTSIVEQVCKSEIKNLEIQLKDNSIGNDFRIDLKARLNQTIKIKEKIENLINRKVT